jgi:hypothetical protein
MVNLYFIVMVFFILSCLLLVILSQVIIFSPRRIIGLHWGTMRYGLILLLHSGKSSLASIHDCAAANHVQVRSISCSSDVRTNINIVRHVA